MTNGEFILRAKQASLAFYDNLIALEKSGGNVSIPENVERIAEETLRDYPDLVSVYPPISGWLIEEFQKFQAKGGMDH